MRRLLLFVLMLALAAPVAVWAQAKPNFFGTWTLDMAKSDPPPARGGGGGQGGGGGAPGGGGRGGGGGGPVTIMQTAADITIGMATYKLDGSVNTIQLQGRGGPQEAKATATWDGAKLVIETTRDMNGMTIKTTDIRSLSADGKEMTVENTTVNPNGETKRKTVFTKS